eukprot:m.53769 g.53769  ORF g.53769 m.53769 type:complete len:464 (-) comp12409_c1_seq1:110-1501(-)
MASAEELNADHLLSEETAEDMAGRLAAHAVAEAVSCALPALTTGTGIGALASRLHGLSLESQQPPSSATSARPVSTAGPAEKRAQSLPHIVTTSLSRIADPGDAGTNGRYTEMMDLVTDMLNKRDNHTFAWTVNDRQATDEELMLDGVHAQSYLDAMKRRTAIAEHEGRLQTIGKYSYGFTIQTEPAARSGAAAVIDVVGQLLESEAFRRTAFVLTRPPSHHAVGNPDRARNASPKNSPFGFCHINGIASAIANARVNHNIQRAVILDWDVHPGNANEDTWFHDPDVLTLNLSQRNIWPGPKHGRAEDVGKGKGVGGNLNFPMPVGEGNAAYIYAFCKHVFGIIDEFEPELLIVASGFDALKDDPYADMALSPPWYGWAVCELLERTDGRCPLVLNLEGGYNPSNVCEAVTCAVDGLTGTTTKAEFLAQMGFDGPADAVRPAEAVVRDIDGSRATQLETIALH